MRTSRSSWILRPAQVSSKYLCNWSFILTAFQGDNFDISKLHSLQHYIDGIKLFGTTLNYDTETSERLHIDCVKNAWRGSNKKKAKTQMAQWLLRRESIHHFHNYVLWRTRPLVHVHVNQWLSPRLRKRPELGMKLAKTPTCRDVSILDLASKYGATTFTKALQTFVGAYRGQEKRYQPRRRDRQVQLYVSRVHVWHLVKFNSADVQLGEGGPVTHDIVRASCTVIRRGGSTASVRFDTVFVNDTGAEAVGIKGEFFFHIPLPSLIISIQVFELDACVSYSRFQKLLNLSRLAMVLLPLGTWPTWIGLHLLAKRMMLLVCIPSPTVPQAQESRKAPSLSFPVLCEHANFCLILASR